MGMGRFSRAVLSHPPSIMCSIASAGVPMNMDPVWFWTAIRRSETHSERGERERGGCRRDGFGGREKGSRPARRMETRDASLFLNLATLLAIHSDRTSLYQEITAKIIAELEAGRLPWVQPWGTSAVQAPLAMPKNATTGRRYSGVNVLILWGAVVQHGFSGQSWLTFRQSLSLGGHVRKGERGTTVVYADRFTPDAERSRAQEQGDDPRSIPFLKRFTVFNADQCDRPAGGDRDRGPSPASGPDPARGGWVDPGQRRRPADRRRAGLL